MNPLELLKKRIQDCHRELLVLQGDIEDTIKIHELKMDSLKKDVNKLIEEIDKINY